MKCKRCQGKAEVQIRQHNSAFCRSCFIFVFQRQVQRTVEKERMFTPEDDVLVAVSGGKDSLGLWDALHTLGYRTTGLHLALGIGDYSVGSTAKTGAFAGQRGLRLITVDLREDGHGVPELASTTRRPACAACGTAKRHYFDRVAFEQGFAVVATGHNLDDEAARLLGNVLHWQIPYLAKQRVVLEPTHATLARKVKPLFRISEYESAVYAFFRGIDYVIEECPNSVGATQLVYKDVLNRLEANMPGTKLMFVQDFQRHAQPLFAAEFDGRPGSCERCGMPAFDQLCSFCRLLAQYEAQRDRQRHPGAAGMH